MLIADKKRAALFLGSIVTLILMVGLALLTPATAFALTPAEIEAANRKAQQIQNEQQERLRQQLLEDTRRGKKTPALAVPEPKAPSLPRGEVCRDINKIVLTGVTLLSKRLQAELIAPYLNQCLFAEDIEKLLAAILKAYMDKGYIAVRPYVQAQDLSQGRLEILIVEGRVGGLILEDEGKKSVNLTTAFPFVTGKPLDLRDIEQGLDQINRLASNSAAMEVSPGEEAGESVVTIRNTPSCPLSISGAMDNMGSPSTGRNQGAATLSLDHPLYLNDFLTFTKRKTLFEDSDYHDSDSNSLFYSLPFGFLTMLFLYSDSSYRSPVTTTTRTLVARGTNQTWRGALNWVAYRDQDQKITTTLALNTKNSKNYLDDAYLNISSRKLTTLDIGVNWNRRFAGFSLFGGLGWSKGLTLFDALEDQGGLDSSLPLAQGSRVTFNAGVSIPLNLLGLYFSSQLSGQYALDPLYGSEQINLGGFYTVRGFNKNSLSGDRGFFVRNEITTHLPPIPHTGIVVSPFIGFDYGHIEAFKTTEGADLSGAVAGLRFSGRYVRGELSAQKSIQVPAAIEREPVQFGATLTVSF